MANTVKMKRSSVAGKIPATADLELGELAVNTHDGKLFLKKLANGIESVVEVGQSGPAGEVTAENITLALGYTPADAAALGDIAAALDAINGV